jgi:hypothetical protein
MFTLPDALFAEEYVKMPQGMSRSAAPGWDLVQFAARHRQALESDEVGERIGRWIDLMFGVDQRNADAGNLYRPILYPDVWLKKNSEIKMTEELIRQLGAVPRQLFDKPHDPRGDRKNKEREVKIVTCRASKFVVVTKGELTTVTCRHGITRGKQQFSTPRNHPVGRCAAVVPIANLFVFTGAADSLVYTINLEHPNETPRRVDRNCQIVAMVAVGVSILVIVDRNGTTTVEEWNDDTSECLYTVNYHIYTTVHADVSECLHAIASVDERRRVVLIELYTGKFLMGFDVEGEETWRESRIMLLDEGFIVLLLESERAEGSVIEVHGLNGKLIVRRRTIAKVVAWCSIERVGRPAEVAVALDNGTIEFLDRLSMDCLTRYQLPSPAESIAYDLRSNQLFVASELMETSLRPVLYIY